jgi:hypothetical protein
MVRDTLIVIALAVVTICILHVLLTRVLLQMAPLAAAAAEGFQCGGGGGRNLRRRPIILPTSHGNSAASPWISDLAHSRSGNPGGCSDDDASSPSPSPAPSHHPQQQNFDSLEDELKQWMRRESGNWAEDASGQKAGGAAAAATDVHTTPPRAESSMSTSIDQVFQEQQVDMNGVHLVAAQVAATAAAEGNRSAGNDMPKEKPPGGVGGYSNVMNSGNLGNGLSAFDGLNSSYATF